MQDDIDSYCFKIEKYFFRKSSFFEYIGNKLKMVQA